mgnify:CR=1 FL=1
MRNEGPDGKQSPWGKIVQTHIFGNIEIVEFTSPTPGFSVYIDKVSTSRGAATLDGAMLIALAFKYDGHGSVAGPFMARLIGLKDV